MPNNNNNKPLTTLDEGSPFYLKDWDALKTFNCDMCGYPTNAIWGLIAFNKVTCGASPCVKKAYKESKSK